MLLAPAVGCLPDILSVHWLRLKDLWATPSLAASVAMFTLFTFQVKGIILERFTYKIRLCTTAKTKKVEHALTTHVMHILSS
jgi:hypothetical protein